MVDFTLTEEQEGMREMAHDAVIHGLTKTCPEGAPEGLSVERGTAVAR